MSAAVSWISRVEAYLAYRRRHGFALSIDETQLISFARFADGLGTAEYLSVALAIEWAQRSRRPSPLSWGRRIEVLRGFARYCLQLDPRTEIPPQSLFGPAHRRLVPHIYSEAELIALLEAAKGLRDFAKANPLLVIKGGVMDGRVLDADTVKKLADLESREVLLAKLAGAMKAKQSQAAALFAAPLSKTARALGALQAKLEALEAAARAAAGSGLASSGSTRSLSESGR